MHDEAAIAVQKRAEIVKRAAKISNVDVAAVQIPDVDVRIQGVDTYFTKLASFRMAPQEGEYEPRGVVYVEEFFKRYRLWFLVYVSPLTLLVKRGWS